MARVDLKAAVFTDVWNSILCWRRLAVLDVHIHCLKKQNFTTQILHDNVNIDLLLMSDTCTGAMHYNGIFLDLYAVYR